MTYAIDITQRPAQTALVVHGNVTVAGIPAFVAGAFGAVVSVVAEQGLSFAGPPFGRYARRPDGSFDVEAGFPVDGDPRPEDHVLVSSLPAGTVARALHAGPYDTLGLAYEAVEKWLAEHDYVPVGAPWESYLDEPGVPNPRTEVFFPCRRADG
jgi:effector-binding domain-containing protein